MRRAALGILSLCLGAVLCAPVQSAGRRRAAADPSSDPLAMGFQIDWSQFESPWGPSLTYEYGSFSPIGGPWEDMVKSGPTFASGLRWKYADFSGDILPPSSTYLGFGYRGAYLKDDEDVQVYGRDGFVGDVGNLRLHLGEFRATQRFIGPIRRGLFVDVGTALGIGAANGKLVAATPDPFDDPLFIDHRKESAFLIRGELNAGAGIQLDWVDLKFSVASGLSGSSALTGQFQGHGDFGARISGTIFLFD
jgi:hypothetical protein